MSIQKKRAFVQLVLNYWTLKRQARNGLPLIRRLKTSSQSPKTVQQVGTPHRQVSTFMWRFDHRLRRKCHSYLLDSYFYFIVMRCR